MNNAIVIVIYCLFIVYCLVELRYLFGFNRVNVQTNKLSHRFFVDFGRKFPWFIEELR